MRTSIGEGKIKVPRDREGTFEPMVAGKHQRDVSGIC
ncbi:MAG TPA: transposase [Candidatus Avisuccinivibrio pullicola]|nr:transposase [Candidatus Avisuccinivibrio pullicola]